ncbi:MAG: cold shock domain-containing protein [Pseudomonadota bacterium]
MSGYDSSETRVIEGRVKWYDVVKGYGFVVPDPGGPDIMVHASCVRSFGRMTLADNAVIKLVATRGERGLHAVELLEVEEPPVVETARDPNDESARPTEYLDSDQVSGPLLPARVKWFDKQKGFGFVNIFGRDEDVFVHMETVRRCGFQDLSGGEGMACRTFRGPRGLMVAELRLWEAGADGDAPLQTQDAMPPDLYAPQPDVPEDGAEQD